MKPSPCDLCLLIPICRHKGWMKFINECPTVQNYFFVDYLDGLSSKKYGEEVISKEVTRRIERVQILIRPTRWKTCYNQNSWVYEVRL